MYLIMRNMYEKNFIAGKMELKGKYPLKVFKERSNAEHYIHNEIPKILKCIDPTYWKGPDTNENHVQMILGENHLREDVYTILCVSEGD